MSKTRIHYPSYHYEKISCPELGSYEVQVTTYESFTCISCVNYENGTVLFHHDVAHDEEIHPVRELVHMAIRAFGLDD